MLPTQMAEKGIRASQTSSMAQAGRQAGAGRRRQSESLALCTKVTLSGPHSGLCPGERLEKNRWKMLQNRRLEFAVRRQSANECQSQGRSEGSPSRSEAKNFTQFQDTRVLVSYINHEFVNL